MFPLEVLLREFTKEYSGIKNDIFYSFESHIREILEDYI